MRVKIEVTLDVNAAEWAEEYGIEDASGVREDVRRWAADRLNRYDDSIARVVTVR